MPPKRGRPPKQTLYETPLSQTQSLSVTRDDTNYYITKSTNGKRDAAPHGYVKVNAGVSADKIAAGAAVEPAAADGAAEAGYSAAGALGALRESYAPNTPRLVPLHTRLVA